MSTMIFELVLQTDENKCSQLDIVIRAVKNLLPNEIEWYGTILCHN